MESNLSIVITTKAGDQTHIAMHGFQSEYQLDVLDCYYQPIRSNGSMTNQNYLFRSYSLETFLCIPSMILEQTEGKYMRRFD